MKNEFFVPSMYAKKKKNIFNRNNMMYKYLFTLISMRNGTDVESQ